MSEEGDVLLCIVCNESTCREGGVHLSDCTPGGTFTYYLRLNSILALDKLNGDVCQECANYVNQIEILQLQIVEVENKLFHIHNKVKLEVLEEILEPKLIIRHGDDLEKSIKCYGCDKSFKSYTRLSKHKCRKKNEESKKSAEEQSSSETVKPKKEDLHLDGNEYVEDKVRVAPFVDLEGQDDLDNLSSFLESNLGARCTLCPQAVEEPTPQKNLRPSRTPLKSFDLDSAASPETLDSLGSPDIEDCSRGSSTTRPGSGYNSNQDEEEDWLPAKRKRLNLKTKINKNKNTTSKTDKAVKVKIKKIQCRFCEAKFASQRNRDDHEKKQHPETWTKLIDCDLCTLRLKTPRLLLKHKASVHAVIVPYPCSICEKEFSSEQEYSRHYKEVHRSSSSCYICGKLLSKEFMSQHLKMAHGVGSLAGPETELMCEVCSKTFKSIYLLNNHRKVHEKPSFSCKACGKAFTWSSSLTAHIQSQHNQGGKKGYRCTVCNWEFSDRNNLKNHMYTHNTGRKPFSCQKCDRGFIRRDMWSKHFQKCEKSS